jgi:recombination protein RecA
MAVKKGTKLDRDLTTKGSIDATDLDDFRKELKKEFGESAALDDDDFITSFIPTGIDPLDYLLGGGIPQGKITEIVGKEGCGKSSFGIYMLGQIQKYNGLGVLIDTENGAGDRFRFENFGVDTKKCIITVEDLAEKAFMQIERVANYIQKKQIDAPSLLVLDSVAGLTTRSELEADYDSGGFPSTARMIKKGIQRCKLMCKETNLAVLFINQTRVKMGGMVNPYTGPELTSPGGDTLKFQAITRLLLDRGKFLGDSKQPEGHIVKAKVIKCKTSASLGRTLPMRFYYDKRGYSNDHIVYDLLNDAGYMGAGAWKTVVLPDGSEKKFNSVDTFIELFNSSEANRNHFLSMMKDCYNKNLGFAGSVDNSMPTLSSEESEEV